VEAIINRRRYSTETATLLADDEYSDGFNRLGFGRATHLYRGPGGSCFGHHETLWHGEHDSIEALTDTAAEALYAELPYKHVAFDLAFPGVLVEEA